MRTDRVIAIAAPWAALGLLLASWGEARGQFGPSPVVVSPVISGQAPPTLSVVGTVRPLRRSVVGSAVDGRVLMMNVDVGDFVRAKDVVAEIRTGTIDIEIAGAKAELRLKQAELDELENGSRPEEVAQARAEMQAAEALMQYGAARLERTQQLFRGNTASQEELDEAVSASAAAAQRFLAAKAHYDLTAAGPRLERIEQARAARDVAQARVELLEDRHEKFFPKAPFDGFISAKQTEVGEWVTQAQPVVEVVQLDQVEIYAYVPEAYVGFVRLGSKRLFHLDAFGGASGREFEATVTAVNPQGDERSRTFLVKLHLRNPTIGGQYALKAGMLASVSIDVGLPVDSLLVPKDALVLDGRQATVYAIETDAKGESKAQLLPVEKGAAIGSWIAITPRGPLAAGAQVVVEGNERLRPGAAVIVSSVKDFPRPAGASGR